MFAREYTARVDRSPMTPTTARMMLVSGISSFVLFDEGLEVVNHFLNTRNLIRFERLDLIENVIFGTQSVARYRSG